MKKLKKSLAVLLSVLMMTSLLTVNTLADDEEPGTTPLTPATVTDPVGAVTNTLNGAAAAEGEVVKDSVLRGDELAEADAAVAAANSLLAASFANEAKKDKEAADEKLGELAEEAKDAVEPAEEAKDAAHEARKDAQEAAKEAFEELGETKDETYREEAQVHAGEAKDAADAAADAAAEAFAARNNAKAEYEKAKAAYDEAVRVWTARELEIKAELAAGLLSAAAAEKEAKEALAKIAEYEAKMNEWAEAAELAAAEAKEAMDAAHKDLADAADTLEKATVEAAKDTAVAAATGAALLATKAVVGVAQGVVNYYEGEIEDLKDQTKLLESQIEEATNELAKLEEEIAKANDKTGLSEAQAAYDAAKEALELAKAEHERALTILEESRNTELKEKINSVSENIKKGEATNEEIIALTDKVFDLKENVTVEWNEEALADGKCVFSITDSNGAKKNYIAVTDTESGTIQYYNAVVAAEKVSTLESATVKLSLSNAFKDLSGDTGYFVIGENGEKLSVTVESTKNKRTYSHKYYVGDKEISLLSLLSLELRKSGTESWKYEDDTVVNNSDLTDLFANAQDAADVALADKNTKVEGSYEALTKLTNAQANYDQATAALNSAKEMEEAIISHNNNAIAENADKINDLDKKLNGDLMDQIIRSVVTGNADAITSAMPNYKDYGDSFFEAMFNPEFRNAWNEYVKKNADIEEAWKDADEILTIIQSVLTGNVGLDTAGAVIELLTSAGLSEKTKLAISEKIEELAQKEYDKAKTELETSAKALENAAKDAADKGAAALAADAAYAVASAEEALAKAAAEDAANLKAEAEAAANLATLAKEQYEELLKTYGPDYSLVVEARKAMLAAGADAAHANADYLRAVAAAVAAQRAYEKAQAIADAKPTRPVVGKPVVKTSVAY